jgi:Flp pilus assembly protein TadG
VRLIRARLASRARQERGQSLVELALVTPLILLLFAGAGDLGRAFYGFIAIENAVKEGVLYGARYSLCDDASTLCPDPDNVAWRFAQELPPGLRNADGTVITPTVTCATPGGTVLTDLRTCDTGFTYAVQATYTFAPLTPMLDEILGGDLTVGTRAVAIVQNEAFDPTPGIAPLKMVRASDAINATEITTKCTQPDPSGSAGYYRAPCIASDNTEVPFRFYASTTANYKIIVRNNGGTNLSGVTMADSLGWPGTCPTPPTTLSVVAAPYTCSYSRTLPATVPGGGATGAYTNTITVDAAETAATIDAATVSIALPPADLKVTKFVSPYKEGSDGDGSPTFGQTSSVAITRSTKITSPYAWFEIIVKNIGGQTATGITITDSKGALPYGTTSTTAVCQAKPTSLAVNAVFRCRYRVSYTTNGVRTNTVTASSPDDAITSNNSATASVTVSLCPTTNRSVPMFAGLSKASAQTAWTNSGLTGTFTNIASGTVLNQTVQAFSCVVPATSVKVTKTATP